MVEGLLVWPGRQMIVGIILLCVNETAIYCFEPAHHCQQMQGASQAWDVYRGCLPVPIANTWWVLPRPQIGLSL